MTKIYNNILFQIVIPFRPNIFPVKLKKVFNDNNSVSFHLHYNSDKLYEIYTYKHRIKNLESTSIIEVEVQEIEIPNVKEYFINRNLNVRLLEIINSFIDIIRYSHYKKSGQQKIHLRNIGLDDILCSHLVVNGVLTNSSHKVSFQENDNKGIFKIQKIEEKIPYSWNALTKAVDLLELGFYNESLIVGFNLLDYCVQETLKQNMQYLTEDEKKQILRKIESRRMETYLGIFLKLLSGRDIYNKELTENELKRLNKFRNEIIHAGKNSSYSDTAKYLKIIYKIIKSLSEFGINYELQDRLIFL